MIGLRGGEDCVVTPTPIRAALPAADRSSGGRRVQAQAAPTVDSRVAERIRRLRHERSWSARDLAEACERMGQPSLSRGTIAKIESGVRKSVTADEVACLARVFGITPTDLLASESEQSEQLMGPTAVSDGLPGVGVDHKSAVEAEVAIRRIPELLGDVEDSIALLQARQPRQHEAAATGQPNMSGPNMAEAAPGAAREQLGEALSKLRSVERGLHKLYADYQPRSHDDPRASSPLNGKQPRTQVSLPVHRAILALDIEHSARRTNPVKTELRQQVYQLMRKAFDVVGIDDHCYDPFTDRGDGVLVLIRPTDEFPKPLLLSRLIPTLTGLLTTYNSGIPPTEQPRLLRLRVVVHAGEVHHDGNGFWGADLDVAFRLLDAPRFKASLRDTTSPLAIVASDTIYESIIRHGYDGIDDGEFVPIVNVSVGDQRRRGWVHLPRRAKLPVPFPKLSAAYAS